MQVPMSELKSFGLARNEQARSFPGLSYCRAKEIQEYASASARMSGGVRFVLADVQVRSIARCPASKSDLQRLPDVQVAE
jgi:hypothetical protein